MLGYSPCLCEPMLSRGPRVGQKAVIGQQENNPPPAAHNTKPNVKKKNKKITKPS